MTRKSALKSVKRYTQILFFTLLYILITPIFLILFIPIYIYRLLILLLAKLFRPDLSHLIDPRSSVLAVDNPYEKPHWNLVVWGSLEGEINFERFRADFNEKVIKRVKSNGKLADPEFRQFYQSFGGFLFWRSDPEFNLDYHFRQYDLNGGEMTHEELLAKVKELTWKPFKPDKSPWEVLYVRRILESGENSQDHSKPKCLLIFRAHHGLMDGYTILRLILCEMGGYSLTSVARPKYKKRGLFKKVALCLLGIVKAPYDLMEMLIDGAGRTGWSLPNSPNEYNPPIHMCITPKIPISLLKEVKARNAVSFTSVLISGISGGIRTFMLSKGMRIPKFMNTAVAVPMPNHPNRLSNYFIFSFMKLPVGTEDPRKRLLKVEKNLRHLKGSTAPLMSFSLVPLVGALPSFLIRPFTLNRFSSFLLSNFPGPTAGEEYYLKCGGISNKVLDLNFSAGVGEGSVGLGIFILSFGDSLRITLTGDSRLVDGDEEMQDLSSKILEEFNQI